MISEHGFNQEGADDLTKDSTAPIDQDYITLFIYLKGQEYDAITVGKKRCESNRRAFPLQLHEEQRATHESHSREQIAFPPCSCPFPE